MANWFKATMPPRMRKGVTSAMYIGEVIEEMSMPTPPRKRKIMNSGRLRGKAVPRAEINNGHGREDHRFSLRA